MSLYSSGFFIRRVFVFFLIFIGLLITFGVITTITKNLSTNLEKNTQEQASLGFGTVTPPSIRIVTQANSFKPNGFSIDTQTGSLPDFSSSFGVSKTSKALVNLYQIDTKQIDNAARDKGFQLASKLAFTGDPTRTENQINYEWNDGKRRLLYSADTRSFEMVTNNVASLDTAPVNYSTDNTSITAFVKDFLKTTNNNVEENLSYFKVEFVKYNYSKSGWDIVPPSQNGDQRNLSNFVRVSYMRYIRSRGKEVLPTFQNSTTSDPTVVKEYYPQYYYSPMYVIVKNQNQLKSSDIVEMSFYRYDFDITRPQTYNVKTVDDAYSEVKGGSAPLVAIHNKDNSPIADTDLAKVNSDLKVKKVELGYYYTSARTGYVLPIYVFYCEFVISTDGTNQTLGEAVYYTYAYK